MAFLWSDRISFFPSHVDPFSLIDTPSFPIDCAEAFSIFDHSYLIIRVLQFLRFHAPFLSTSRSIFEHVYPRSYLSMPILFPRGCYISGARRFYFRSDRRLNWRTVFEQKWGSIVSTLLWFLTLCFQISWLYRYKPVAVLFDFFLWLPSIFTLSCLLHGYDMPYFFLAEVFYTGYIFSSAFPTALLLL